MSNVNSENNSNLMSLDLTPFMVLGLATNSLITKDIDKIYEKYKYKAYNAAKKSKYYSMPLLTDGSIKREVSAKRALGIIELNNDKDCVLLDSSVMKLFEKGWNSLYNYVRKCEIIDIDYVLNNIIANRDDDDYYVGFNAVLLVFAEMFSKEIVPNDFRNSMANFFSHYMNHIYTGDRRFSYDFVIRDKELYNKALSIKVRFLEYFKALNSTCDLVDLAIYDEEVASFCRSINAIFDSENMMLSSMCDNAKIIDKYIIELAALYYIHNKNQNRLESAKFILSGLHLKYAIKSYKDLKNFYFENNKETLYLELDNYERQANTLKEDNLSLKRQIEALESENRKLRKDYKESIEKENILLKKQVEKLENSVASLKNDKIQLNLLIDSFFNDDDNDNDEIIQEDSNIIIPNIKGVIAGGHSNWHDKIKIKLPDSFIYVEGTNERFDENILDNKDCVFIYTKYMGHGFYYKLIEKCKKINMKTYYISSTSPTHLEREIYNFINNKKPTVNK